MSGSNIFQHIYITNLDKTHRYSALSNESHKKLVKAQYDKSVQPRVLNEGDLVLNYDQKHDKLGKGKMKSMWYGPYIIIKVLEKGAYELVDYDNTFLEASQWAVPEKVLFLGHLASIPCIYLYILNFSVVFFVFSVVLGLVRHCLFHVII